MLKKYSIITCLFIILFIISCSSKIHYSSEEVSESVKNLKAKPDSALVFVFQSSTYLLMPSFQKNIFIDYNYAGSIQSNSFIYTYLAAGKHIISVGDEDNVLISFSVVPGERYYIEHLSSSGVTSKKSSLKLVEIESGREKISDCSLSTLKLLH